MVDTDGRGRSVSLEKVLRDAVALLGVGALVVAGLLFVEIARFVLQEPSTAAEAHAMAHSAVGVAVAGVYGAGLVAIGGVLLGVAYMDRRRLSAATLLVSGLVGLFLLQATPMNPLLLVPLLAATLGGYAFYDDAVDADPFQFMASATAVLWFVDLVLFASFWVGPGSFLGPMLPFIGTWWTSRLLTAGALAILAGSAWQRYEHSHLPVAPVVLAASVLLPALLGPIWGGFSQSPLVGVDPIEWTRLLVGTLAAVAVLMTSDFGRGSERDGGGARDSTTGDP